jgi:hypothetical protein
MNKLWMVSLTGRIAVEPPDFALPKLNACHNAEPTTESSPDS